MNKNFMGLNTVFWMGVVESRQDPLRIGRAQVRIYGWHTEDKSEIPTEDLPWAHSMIPVTETSPQAPKEGDIVIGIFLDGEHAQHPMMLGKVVGMPKEIPPANKGFSDPGVDNDIAPVKPKDRTIKPGGGVEVEEEEPGRYAGGARVKGGSPNDVAQVAEESNVSRLARNEHINAKPMIPAFLNENKITANSVNGTTWEEPGPGNNTQYPYSGVKESESGHIQEFDDTKGNERVSMFHRTGTGYQIYPTGTESHKVVKDNFDIIHGNDFHWVGGKIELSVENQTKVRIKGATIIEIDGDFDLRVGGTVNISAGKGFNVKTGEGANFDIGKSWTVVTKEDLYQTAGGDTNLYSKGDFNFDAETVYAQSGKAKNSSVTGLKDSMEEIASDMEDIAAAADSVAELAEQGTSVSSLSSTISTIGSSLEAVSTKLSGAVEGIQGLMDRAGADLGNALREINVTMDNINTGINTAIDDLAAAVDSSALSDWARTVNGLLDDVNSTLSAVDAVMGSAQQVVSEGLAVLAGFISDLPGQVIGLKDPNDYQNPKENINKAEKCYLDGRPLVETIFDPYSNVLRNVVTNLGPVKITLSSPILGKVNSIVGKLMQIGFRVEQAKAIASVMMDHSGFNTYENDRGFGLLCFSGQRYEGLKNYAANNALDITNQDTQIEYIRLESSGEASNYGGANLLNEYRSTLALGNTIYMATQFSANVVNTSITQKGINYANAFTEIVI